MYTYADSASLVVAQSVKNLPAVHKTACNAGDLGSTPGSGGSSGEGNGNPSQYSYLTNSKDREAWWDIQSLGLQRVGHDND